MRYYLVEEHTSDYAAGLDTVSFHKVLSVNSIRGDKNKEASYVFRAANELSKQQRTRTWKDPALGAPEPVEFAFGADELVEVQEGYFWGAADGSSVYYEVRYLGDFEVNWSLAEGQDGAWVTVRPE